MKNAVLSAAYTALWTFLGSLAVLCLSWLTDLANWANTSGHAQLPNLSTAGFAVLSALLAAASGFVTFAVRGLQASGVLPGQPPTYDKATGG
jgi:hypothetical protein